MRLAIIIIILQLFSSSWSFSQRDEKIDNIHSSVITDIKNSRSTYNKVIRYRTSARLSRRTARAQSNRQLKLSETANNSLREARNRLKNQAKIRKEKSDLLNEFCDKKYNAYVQHDCYAFADSDFISDSLLLYKNEIVVLLKSKKEYYMLCLDGFELFVKKGD